MMIIENKYELGQVVYLVTDPDQFARMVTCVRVSPTGISYALSKSEAETFHFECEISEQKQYVSI